MAIKVIRPEVFAGQKDVQAFFTLKNAQLQNREAFVEGLNLGYNTQEIPEVVTQNRQLLLAELRIDRDWIAFANQVHSNRVTIVNEGGTFAETDALITQIPGLALAIQVADCAAVLLADSDKKTIAAVHAGWRGAAGDIVLRTLEKMKTLGARTENCRAFISPCISVANFEVGDEVADQFPPQFVDAYSYKKPHVDLKGFLVHQLLEAGLPEINIEVNPECTIEKGDRYYSYRREKDQSGRMMAVIKLAEL